MSTSSRPINIPVPHYYAESTWVNFFLTELLFLMDAGSCSSWAKAEEKAAKFCLNGRQLHEITRAQWELMYPGEGFELHMYIHRHKDAYVCFRLGFFSHSWLTMGSWRCYLNKAYEA